MIGTYNYVNIEPQKNIKPWSFRILMYENYFEVYTAVFYQF